MDLGTGNDFADVGGENGKCHGVTDMRHKTNKVSQFLGGCGGEGAFFFTAVNLFTPSKTKEHADVGGGACEDGKRDAAIQWFGCDMVQ